MICISYHDIHLCQTLSTTRGVLYLRWVSLIKSDSQKFDFFSDNKNGHFGKSMSFPCQCVFFSGEVCSISFEPLSNDCLPGLSTFSCSMPICVKLSLSAVIVNEEKLKKQHMWRYDVIN